MTFNPLGKLILAAGDPFTATQNLANTSIGKFQMIAAAIFGLVLVITGIVYAISGAETKGKIKKKWTDVGVAVVVVFGAVMIIAFAINFVQTGGFN